MPPHADVVQPTSRRRSSPIRAASDRRLARRASGGDRQAVAAIFERYQQELYGFCLGLLGEPQDAQDALQNTMVKVLRALPGEEREIALRPWLYRIARNEAIELRRRSHPAQPLEAHLVDGHASVIERAEQREHLQWLLNDLGDLPDRQRTVLVMRELGGLDFAEIAAALDTSGAVVRQALYEARRNLEQMDRGRSLGCEAVTKVLSDADRRITRRRDIRAHLRHCPDCRRFRDAIGKRERVLATIPPISLPAGAAAAVAQALGGSGSGVAGAVLSGSAVQSAGAYGVLKAAGTFAAVAVIGTAAIQGEVKGGGQNPLPRDAVARDRSDPARSASQRRAKTVAADPASAPRRLAYTADGLPAAPIGAHISDRRPRSSLVGRNEAAFEAATRPSGPPGAAPYVARPPEGVAAPEEEGALEEEGAATTLEQDAPPAGMTEQAEQTGEDQAKAGEPEKEPGPPAPGTPSPPPSAADPAPPKTPPGQAKKEAGAEVQAPSSAPSEPPESGPAETGREAPRPVVDPGSNGKAKGHER